MHVRRLCCHIGVLVSLHTLWLVPHPSIAEEILDTLTVEYQSYDLPFPPDDAKLVVRKSNYGSVNGVQQFHVELEFRIGPAENSERAIYWYGCEPVTSSIDYPDVEVAQPDRELAEKSSTARPEWFARNRFPTFPDLVLAIQCKQRGWNELAEALLQRSRRPASQSDYQVLRPREDQRALALVAWNYWCNQFAERKGDRRAVIDHLQRLIDGEHGLDTTANRNILADMIATSEKKDVEPDSFEAVIESLTELDTDVIWPTYDSQSWRGSQVGNIAELQRLRDAGLNAVPTLINHLHDYRLTRCIATTSQRRYTWHVRIADVVALMLNDLNPDGFAYDFRMLEGRGRSLDQNHVWHWWTEAQGTSALEYLLKSAVTADSQGALQANEGPLRALGQQFPDQLAKIFVENVDKVKNPSDLFSALSTSKISQDEKTRLLLAAVESENSSKRGDALQHLLQMKHPQAAALLVRELERLPITPAVPYWHSGARHIGFLMRYTDDEHVWNTFTKTARRVDIGQRLELLYGIASCADSQRQRVIAVLAEFLDDDEVRTISREFPQPGEDTEKAFERIAEDPFLGPVAGFMHDRLAVRDFAALEIAELLGMVSGENANWTDEEWKNFRDRVRTELAERNSEN